MSDPLAHLAIQSWCLRGWREPAEVITRMRDIGIGHIELCGFHADPDDIPGSARILEHYLSAGLQITAFGVHTFNADRAQARRVFSFAKNAGAHAISADFAPGGAAIAQELSREFSIAVGVHNHGRRHRYGSLDAVGELLRDHPGIGLYLDTAWMLDSGEDPVTVATIHRDRLVGLHLKDFLLDSAGKPADVVAGTGNLKLDDLAGLLMRTSWQGSLTIEYEGDVHDPVPALRRCVDAVRSAWARAPANPAKAAKP